MILNNIINLVLIALLFLIPNRILAKNDKDELIHLQADSIHYNFKKGIIFYEGHVHAEKNLTQLYANTMTVYYNRKKIEKIIAKGTPAYYSTRPDTNKDPLQAWASNIIFFPITSKVQLIGNVKVQQKENQFEGPRLFYDMKKQRVISQANRQSKVQLIIEPLNTLQKHDEKH